MKRIFLFLIVALACTTGMTSCGEDNKEPGNVPLTGITTDPGSISLNVRYSTASANVKFSPVPANATDVDFEVNSADESIATISGTNLGETVVTVLKPGTTTVTITSGQVKKEIPVTGSKVTALTEIELSTDSIPSSASDTSLIFTTLSVGDSIKVTASAYPRDANTDTTEYVTFKWTSDNPTVATVTPEEGATEAVKKGKIKVIGTGEAWITISCDEVPEKEDENGEMKKVPVKKFIYIINPASD